MIILIEVQTVPQTQPEVLVDSNDTHTSLYEQSQKPHITEKSIGIICYVYLKMGKLLE